MPQMMPLNWLMLFMLISLLLIMFNIGNYFSLNQKLNHNFYLKMMKNSMNWKW